MTLKSGVGVVRALKMGLLDRPYTTFYWSAIVSISLCCTIFELFDVEYIIGHWKSFKLVGQPFKSLGAVSCSLSIVTMAVSLTVY